MSSVSSWFSKSKQSGTVKSPSGKKTSSEEKDVTPEMKKYSTNILVLIGNLKLAVTLPEGEDLNEWIAANTVDFYKQISMLYGTITEWCTKEACTVMNAGPKYEYHWMDGQKFKKAVRVSAPEYVDYLMNWVQQQIDDESIFPSKLNTPFSRDFVKVVQQIFKRLFRVYAHIYHSHFSKFIALGQEAHLNTSFKHFIVFVQEFNLIDKKELAPLSELIECLTSS